MPVIGLAAVQPVTCHDYETMPLASPDYQPVKKQQ